MNSPLTLTEILLRILAATLAGALVGLERETHGRPAGLRTTILTCVASAISMIVSESLFIESGDNTTWRPDPARLGAGILTGIGFLGAGTIMRHRNIIRGVTTAASLWFVTVIGLALGSGLYLAGTVGLGVALVSLILLPGLEKRIPSDWYSTLTVVAEMNALSEAELRSRLQKLDLRPKRFKLKYDLTAAQVTMSVEVQFNRRKVEEVATTLMNELKLLHGIKEICWR
jgi:putative Mg2+ transporter-C (MgtC) family protein